MSPRRQHKLRLAACDTTEFLVFHLNTHMRMEYKALEASSTLALCACLSSNTMSWEKKLWQSYIASLQQIQRSCWTPCLSKADCGMISKDNADRSPGKLGMDNYN